jgi:hypothetical protein
MSDEDLDYRALFGGRFLSAPDMPTTGQTVRIVAVGVEAVEDPKTKQNRDRLVVHLDSRLKPWLPCRTTAGCLAHLWGERTGGWVGKLVTLRQDPTVRVGSKVVGGIRVMGAPHLTEAVTVAVNLGARKPPAQCRLVPTGDPLPLALAALQASEAALAGALSALPKPTTIPTEPDRRARLAQKLLSGWPGVSDVIRGTAPAANDHHEAPAEGGEE